MHAQSYPSGTASNSPNAARPIADYRLSDGWCTALGIPGESFQELAAGVHRQLSGVFEVRERVTDNGASRSRATVTDNRLRGCHTCGGAFVAKRSDARYCGATCRQRASRAARRRAA